jgi:hypothetical protein
MASLSNSDTARWLRRTLRFVMAFLLGLALFKCSADDDSWNPTVIDTAPKHLWLSASRGHDGRMAVTQVGSGPGPRPPMRLGETRVHVVESSWSRIATNGFAARQGTDWAVESAEDCDGVRNRAQVHPESPFESTEIEQAASEFIMLHVIPDSAVMTNEPESPRRFQWLPEWGWCESHHLANRGAMILSLAWNMAIGVALSFFVLLPTSLLEPRSRPSEAMTLAEGSATE